MDIEEAIQHLKEARKYPVAYSEQEQEAYEKVFAALRAQQTPSKLDRSRWNGCEHCDVEWEPGEYWSDDFEYDSHEFRIDDDSILYHDSRFGWEGVTIKFCPFCGRPLTEEAWAELERRINGGTTD